MPSWTSKASIQAVYRLHEDGPITSWQNERKPREIDVNLVQIWRLEAALPITCTQTRGTYLTSGSAGSSDEGRLCFDWAVRSPTSKVGLRITVLVSIL